LKAHLYSGGCFAGLAGCRLYVRGLTALPRVASGQHIVSAWYQPPHTGNRTSRRLLITLPPENRCRSRPKYAASYYCAGRQLLDTLHDWTRSTLTWCI